MSELVERSGTAAATVRFYLAEGLLPAPTRAQANRYLYDERHVEIVRFIRILRDRRGLSLEDILRLLPELLPDLSGTSSTGVFRPEMFAQLIAGTSAGPVGPSIADQLVAAGLAAFATRGFAEVSVDDICRVVKIAKGSFYRHFASKEDLFVAVTRRIPVLFAAELAQGRSIELAIRPNLATLLELASLASRDRDRYREALAALVDGLGDALVASGVAEDRSAAEPVLAGLLGCVVLSLGGRDGEGATSEAAGSAKQSVGRR